MGKRELICEAREISISIYNIRHFLLMLLLLLMVMLRSVRLVTTCSQMMMMMRRRRWRSEVVSSQWICDVTEVCTSDELSYDRVLID